MQTEQQEQQDDQEQYSIANVEKKVKELKNAVLKIGYEILSKMDKKEDVPPELLAEQSLTEKQHTIFNKMLNQIKKDTGFKAGDPFSEIMHTLSEVKMGMADIQQKIN